MKQYIVFLLLLGAVTGTYAKSDRIPLNPNETLVQALDIDLDSDGNVDKLLITKKNDSDKAGYILTILNADAAGNLQQAGRNTHIFSCSYCIRTEKVLYEDNIDTKKAKQFSILIENRGNNATFTFGRLPKGQWHVLKVQSAYVNDKGKWIEKKKSYPKDYQMIPFNQFNPDLFY